MFAVEGHSWEIDDHGFRIEFTKFVTFYYNYLAQPLSSCLNFVTLNIASFEHLMMSLLIECFLVVFSCV